MLMDNAKLQAQDCSALSGSEINTPTHHCQWTHEQAEVNRLNEGDIDRHLKAIGVLFTGQNSSMS